MARKRKTCRAAGHAVEPQKTNDKRTLVRYTVEIIIWSYKMNYAPIARIILRYGAAAVFGLAQGEVIAGDPDVVSALALGLAAAVEASYLWAKKMGWRT